MTAVITGLVLATSAGLNAYIPLLALGLLGRFTSLLELPEGWTWIASDWALIVLGVLFIVETLVDKVPFFDTVNDVLQTVIRPASGGMVFAAGSGSETIATSDPSALFQGETLWALVTGALIALIPHLAKALGRPILNALTGGASAAVLSTAEDVAAVVLSALAVLVPLLAVGILIGVVVAMSVRIRKARRQPPRA